MNLRRLILGLSLASGWCGIAYELLYSRLLTTYLGDMFHVNAAILCSFLLGIGVGAKVAHRWVQRLWAIEVLIGLYALGVALGMTFFADGLLTRAVPNLSGGVLLVTATAFALCLVPATLIGFSVPLFSLYLEAHSERRSTREAFASVYWLYNLGAALCIVAMEYWLLRRFGVRATVYGLALTNIASGLLVRLVPVPPAADVAKDGGDRKEVPVWALFAASALSGLFQLFLLKIVEIVFGPFHENFALVLALVLVGIAVGTHVVRRLRISFADVLSLGALAVGLNVVLLGSLVRLWAGLNGTFGVAPVASELLKAFVLVLIGGIPLAVFGATIPALLEDERQDRAAVGKLLLASSLGNCAGYLLAVLFLYERLSYGTLALLFPAGLWILALAVRPRGLAPAKVGLVGAIPIIALLPFVWPEDLFHLSYREYVGTDSLEKALDRVADYEVLRRRDGEVNLVHFREGETAVVINGYRSLLSSRNGHTNLKEMVVGMAPALYSDRRERALVLGLGTGITGAATAMLYRRTTGVEISPAVVAALPRFAQNNFDLLHRPGFDLVLDDGLGALARSSERFDAIVSTVTSPLYFASSKLYTREFFQLAKSRLAPGGVYAMWFDARVTATGADIIFETLRQSFRDCHMIYLTPVYSELVCADRPLFPRPLPEEAWPAELVREFGVDRLGLSANEFLEALVFTRHDIFKNIGGAEANTFDRPRLEFLMAAASLAKVSAANAWTPYWMAKANLRVKAFSGSELDDSGLAVRCAVFKGVGEVGYPDCDAFFKSPGGQPFHASYLKKVLAFGEDREVPEKQLGLLRQLAALGECPSAIPFLERLEPQLRGRLAFEELRARCRLDQGSAIGDADLDRLYRSGPLQPAVRRILARVAQARGRADLAAAHAKILGALGGFTAADQALVDGSPSPAAALSGGEP